MRKISIDDAMVMKDQIFSSNGWITASYVPLDCSEKTVPFSEAVTKPISKNNKKKGNTMCYDCDLDGGYGRPTVEQQRIDYLKDRVFTAAGKKEHDALGVFGLRDNDPPADAEDFLKRIQDGKFILDEKKKKGYWYDTLRYIRWRDPELKEDKEGFDKVQSEINKERDATLDIVMISDPKEGLEALKAFESKAFH